MINVTQSPYNCQPGGTFDNAPGLQQAFNDAVAAYPGQPAQRVYIPAGHYMHYGTPLRITSGVSIVGDGPNSTILQHGTGNGPGIIVAPAVSKIGAPPMGSDSNGSFYSFDGSNGWGYDLRNDTGRVDINGWPQFCVEATVTPTQIPGGPNLIVSSYGRRGGGEPITNTFYIGTQQVSGGNGTIIAELNVGGTNVSLSGGTISVGNAYHIALSYDGATVYLWLTPAGGQSALVASKPASGTITQSNFEDVMFGPSSEDWPACTTLLSSSFVGSVYCLRFSNTARYTTAFSFPGFILSTDSSTKLCLDANYGAADLCIISTMHDYIPVRWFSKVSVAAANEVELQDLNIGSGLLMMYAQDGYQRNVTYSGRGKYSLMLWNNCFHHDWEHVKIIGGSYFGFVGCIAAGLIRVSGGLEVIGSVYPLVLVNGSMTGDSISITQSAATDIGLFCKSAGGDGALQCGALNFDAESGEGQLFLSQMLNVTISGGLIAGLSKPTMAVDGGQGMSFIGTAFESGSANMIHVINMPTSPVTLLNCSKSSGAVWADNMSAIRIV